MPIPINFAALGAPALTRVLFAILDEGQPGAYRLPCATPHEALNLRSRLNKIRATERKSRARDYKEMGLVNDTIEGKSQFDRFIFRVDGPDVIVEATDPHITGVLEAVIGPTGRPMRTPERPAPNIDVTQADVYGNGTGAYDTAPRADEDPFA